MVRIGRKALLDGLKVVLRAIEKKAAIPVLTCVEIKVSGGTLSLRGCNLDVEIRCEVEVASSEKDFTLNVPAWSLFRRLSAIDDIETTLEVVAGVLEVFGVETAAKFRVRGFLDDLPGITMEPEAYSVAFAEGQLHGLLRPVAWAMSTEDTRYYLNGVSVETDDSSGQILLRATATDGHNLESRATAIDGLTPQPRFIIPSNAVGIILGSPLANEIRMGVSAKHIRLTMGGTTATARLIDGTYPDWRRVVPTLSERYFEVDCMALAKALRLADSMSAGRNHRGIAVVADGNRMIIRGRADIGEECESSLPAVICGPVNVVGLNCKYLAQHCKIRAGRMRIHVVDEGSPILFSTEAEPFSVGIMMPMRLETGFELWPPIIAPEVAKPARRARAA